MKLFIAIPTGRDFQNTHFVKSLLGTYTHILVNGVGGKPIERINIKIRANSSNLVNARNELMEEAISGGFTHLWFLDDDMRFPANSLDKLYDPDKAVITVNYCKKKDDLQYTAVSLKNEYLDSRGKTGHEQVLKAATGMMLIELDKVKHMKRPFFYFPWLEKLGKCGGEDYYFCDRLFCEGIAMYIDHDLSNEVAHIGTRFHNINDYE